MRKRLIRFFRPATTDNPSSGISCSVAELVELRHLARSLSLKGSRPAYSIMSGSMLSKFRGRGMDYTESRVYTPGDDIRHLDWRVTARTGRLHTKLYTEERDRPVLTLIDFGPTLYFGTREAFKSVIAARLAALIGWTAVLNGDRIGGLLAVPERKYELRPRAGRQGVLRLIRFLVEATARIPDNPAGSNGLESLVQQALRSVKPGSRIFLISDFFHLYDGLQADLARLSRHSDLILCQLIDPLELTPPPAGRYRITDGRRRVLLDTGNPETFRAWRERFQARHAAVSRLAQNLKLPRLEIVSGQDLAGIMRRGLSLSRRNGNRRAA